MNVGEAQADLEVTLSQSQILLRIRFFTTMTLVSKTREVDSIPMTLPPRFSTGLLGKGVNYTIPFLSTTSMTPLDQDIPNSLTRILRGMDNDITSIDVRICTGG